MKSALENARIALLAERNEAGHWEGELSTSALSTATAIVALGCVDEKEHAEFIENGCRWLIENQNADGGWGDTVKSFSNISTTLLAWSALSKFGGKIGGAKRPAEPKEERQPPTDAAQRDASPYLQSVEKAAHWIRDYIGSLDPQKIAETVSARYGKDRTFSVPILMLCAICGRLGKNGWKLVPPLPFELSIFPRQWFAALQLPVVSYALPALIAIGYARHRNVFSPLAHPIRKWAWNRRASALLEEIQPASGGFLEAAPLSSFVTMALASAGQKNHPVAKNAVRFLTENVRPDGSWPIDTNLATWGTTLAVKSLGRTNQQGTQNESTGSVRDGETNPQGGKRACSRSEDGRAPAPQDSPIEKLFDRDAVLKWLLNQQYREIHPFTNSPPGGWAWTDLSGGVPDADDTPGALLALKILAPDRVSEAEAAIIWLLDLQNRDGGMPTFCRGWGALPFDRSSPDLTAHAIRAWLIWREEMPEKIQLRIDEGIREGRRFLVNTRNSDGSWTPLWFGNQHLKRDEENPTYGTAMVLKALLEMDESELAEGALDWLRQHQNSDGGWGGGFDTPSSIEETALALGALAAAGEINERGLDWLLEATKNGTHFPASPIGFYFAKLWYFERLYPMVWTVEALELINLLRDDSDPATCV